MFRIHLSACGVAVGALDRLLPGPGPEGLSMCVHLGQPRKIERGLDEIGMAAPPPLVILFGRREKLHW